MKVKKDKKDTESQELRNQLARALADYDNLRRRTEEEKKQWINFASQRVVVGLLPIFDMLDLSLEHTKDQGLAIAIGEFKSILKEEGLEQIKPEVGSEFDHDLMEVIDTINTDDENKNGKVESLLNIGWKYKDGPVVRHARVKVFKKGENKNE